MNTKIARFSRFLQHSYHTRSRFDLHSPFVYKLYKEILQDKTSFFEYKEVENVRSAMMNHPGFIRMMDFGSKSTDIRWDKKVVRTRNVARHSAVSPRYGQFLFRLARHFKPESILEMGTSLGISTSYLATGNPESKVVTIEGCPETAEFARRNFEHLGLKNIRQIIGNFDEVLPRLLPETGKIKMFFIDGNHRKEPTLKYFSQILEYVGDDSVLILDDIHWSRDMEKAWEEIRKHPSVKVTIDLFQMGLVFFSERLSKEDFILRF
jgi:predicted O-methyltransferase YrrM